MPDATAIRLSKPDTVMHGAESGMFDGNKVYYASVSDCGIAKCFMYWVKIFM